MDAFGVGKAEFGASVVMFILHAAVIGAWQIARGARRQKGRSRCRRTNF
jgi:hypothetical protein